MKKIRDKIERNILCADRKWKAFPAERQRLFTKLFFAGYVIVTLLVLINICISTGNKTNTMLIGHINSISDHAAVKKSAEDKGASSTLKK